MNGVELFRASIGGWWLQNGRRPYEEIRDILLNHCISSSQGLERITRQLWHLRHVFGTRKETVEEVQDEIDPHGPVGHVFRIAQTTLFEIDDPPNRECASIHLARGNHD